MALCEVALLAAMGGAAAAEPALFTSRQLTPAGEYTFGIEGPPVDAAGILYVVNYGRQGTIGKLSPGAAKSELFAELPAGSIGNSIRFDPGGRMYVADYKGHNVFVFAPGETEPRVYFRSDRFNQPNDMAIAADGTIYASDPHWRRKDGQIWRITRGPDGEGHGEPMSSERTMSTTNGIAISPDGATLYVGESDTREIWAYRLDGATLAAPRLLAKFGDFGLDGIRTDVLGRLFVTRILKGTVAVLLPKGALVREIRLQAKEPSNLAFGGPDGKTVYVTQRQGGFIESFRTDQPGREHCLHEAKASDPACRVATSTGRTP